jgi:hypothetical protein
MTCHWISKVRYIWRWDPCYMTIFPLFSFLLPALLSLYLSILIQNDRAPGLSIPATASWWEARPCQFTDTTLSWCLKELGHEDWKLDLTFPMVDPVVDPMESRERPCVNGLMWWSKRREAAMSSCDGERGAGGGGGVGAHGT